jgi:hypothetical protein
MPQNTPALRAARFVSFIDVATITSVPASMVNGQNDSFCPMFETLAQQTRGLQLFLHTKT